MRQLLAIALLLLFVTACSHDDDEPLRKFMSFQVDSLIVQAEQPLAIYSPANLSDADASNDYPVLSITAAGIHGESIMFVLVSETDSLQPGSYNSDIPGNGVRLGFQRIPQVLMGNSEYGALNFKISSVQDTLIEGSFTGTLVDTTGAISPKSLKKGFIRAVFKRQPQQP